MKTLTKQEIIKKCNYHIQLLCWSIFAICGIGMPLLSLINIEGGISFSNPNFIIGSLFMLAFPIIPFGYFLGIRNIIKTLKIITAIKTGNISIIEMKVVDKYEDYDKCIVFFDKLEKGRYFNYSTFKEIRKGNTAYIIFTGKDGDINKKESCGIFLKKNYQLDTELLKLVKHI